MRHDDLRGQPSERSPVGLSHCLGIETASQSSLAKADEPRLDRGQHEGRLEHRLGGRPEYARKGPPGPVARYWTTVGATVVSTGAIGKASRRMRTNLSTASQ